MLADGHRRATGQLTRNGQLSSPARTPATGALPESNGGDETALRRRIPCLDQDGRESTVTVLVLGDRVAVILPPGDIVVLDPAETTEFADLLGHVSTVAAFPRAL